MKKEMKKEKIIVLLSKVCMICCEDALYQFGYMDLVLKDNLHSDCRIDIPFARLKNCVFYLEDNTMPRDYSKLCFNSKFHCLKFNSDRFNKITRDLHEF